MPKRLQQKRERGWRMPENSRGIGRPSRYGSPFIVEMDPEFDTWVVYDPEFDWVHGPGIDNDPWTKEQAIQKSLELFRQYAEERLEQEPEWLDPLRGKDLYCWCKEGKPCHGDILIELANR